MILPSEIEALELIAGRVPFAMMSDVVPTTRKWLCAGKDSEDAEETDELEEEDEEEDDDDEEELLLDTEDSVDPSLEDSNMPASAMRYSWSLP